MTKLGCRRNPLKSSNSSVSKHFEARSGPVDVKFEAKSKKVTKYPRLKTSGPSTSKESEVDFSSWFDALATLTGWTWCGFRPARQMIDGLEQYRTPVIGQKGLPDRILARGGSVLLVEFKTKTGKLSDGQKIWGKALEHYPNYYVVRPSDREKIEEILR